MRDVLGHDEAKQRFARTLQRGRLASTYLLVGPEGVGKRWFAERLAAALLCENADPSTLEGCGHCESCRLAAAGAHPDLLRVSKPDGKSTLPVELLIGPPDKRNREGLCHDLALRPFVGARRVAIIDDADSFSVEAANCLLKTLEEPPPASVLFLVGTSLTRQLPTIRSRAQVVRFGRLTTPQVAAILQSSPFGMPPETANALAAESAGSVSRALMLQDDAIAGAREAVAHCLTARQVNALGLFGVLEEQSKAAGTEPRLRRQALREMLAAAIEVLHERLVSRAEDPTSVERDLAALSACLNAEEALGRNANQSALAQRLAEELAA